MTKITEEQLDTIRNAKTKDEAWKTYEAIISPLWKAYWNWEEPEPDYSNMSKEELINIIKGETNE